MTSNRYLLLIVLLTLHTSLTSQAPIMEVEGNVIIEGLIDAHTSEDTTSVYLGHDSGISIDFNNRLDPNGLFNTFFGSRSGLNNTYGGQNSFFGERAGQNVNSGSRNSFFGQASGAQTQNGNNNSFFGNGAGSTYQSGSNNALFGRGSGNSSISGDNNTFIGTETGLTNVEGANNTSIGYQADFSHSNAQHQIVIGANAKGKGDSTAVVGSSIITDVFMAEDGLAKVHMGDADVNGVLKITEVINLPISDIVPSTPTIGDIYLDDGTNTLDEDIGFRVYTASGWVDI